MLDVTSVVPLRVLKVLQERSAAFTATNGSLSEMSISKDPGLVVRNVAVVSAQMMVGVDGVSRFSPLLPQTWVYLSEPCATDRS